LYLLNYRVFDNINKQQKNKENTKYTLQTRATLE